MARSNEGTTMATMMEMLVRAGWSPRVVEDHIVLDDVAPDSDGEDTGPGSAWYDETDEILADVRSVLPDGWTAEWSDDDILIEEEE